MINATLAIIKLMNPELLLVAAAVAVVVGAAAGLAYLWSTTETGRVAIKAFAADWKLAWGGISDAVKAGQLALAFKILFKTIELEWKRFWDSLWKEMNKGIGMIMPKGLDKNPLEGAVNAWAHGVPFIGQELRRFALKQAGEWTPEDEKEFKKRTDAILKEHGRIQNRMDKRADGIDPDIARLERELKDLRDKARQAVNAMPKKAAVETLKHGPMEVADLAQGTFSPYALGQSFGLANNKVTERIAKAAEATAENTKQMNDKLDDAGLNVD
jgi:hypothetical protein